MKPKKRCSECTIGYVFSKGLCKYCWKKQFGKPINKISTSHKETLKQYAPIRKLFLEENPECQLKLRGCTYHATCVHHLKSKHSRAIYLDDRYYMASCIACNSEVETIGATAYELGLKIKHNAKE